MPHEHHYTDNKKKLWLINFVGFLVAVASTLIFYNSTIDDQDPTQNFNFSTNILFKILIMLLSGLVGINEFFSGFLFF